MRDGQPFFVGPGGLVDVRVNRWFCSDELRGLSRSTWRKYAYSLLVWLNFLSAYGVGWDEADAEAQDALKVWRVSDDRNPGTVAPGTYHHDLVALRLFYVWAAAEYGVANPIRMRRGWGRRRDGSAAERPVTAPSAVRDRDVKWFDPAGFVRFRDVGLMGFTVDGRDDPGFRGRNGQRDGAFVDVCRNRASLAGVGICAGGRTAGRHPHRPVIHLSAGCCDREIWARSKRYGCRDGCWWRCGAMSVSGPHAVRRARQAGRYERRGCAVVTRCWAHGGCGAGRSVIGGGCVAGRFGPTARRRLLVEIPTGWSGCAVAQQDRLPRDPHGWEHTFTTANERLARLGFTGLPFAAHDAALVRVALVFRSGAFL
jgi:hypothetical protein